jgi:hypothetical protein
VSGGERQGTIVEALDATLHGTLAAGLLGTSGRLTGQQVLAAVKTWLRDGSLVLAQREEEGGVIQVRGAALMALAGGEVTARHMLGRFAGLAATGLSLHAYPHPATEAPQLPAFAGGSAIGALRALPLLGPPQSLVPGATDLKSLLPRLRGAGWSGAIVGTHGDVEAVAVMTEGRVSVARADRGGVTLSRLDALRSLQRMAVDADSGALTLVPLEPRLAAALSGLALERTHAGDPAQLTGVIVAADGYAFVTRGEPYLTVATEPVDPPRAYPALEVPTSPDLHLPDEPPGWETRRYVLTLRGRDALNPMTELWMRFRTAYGAPGQRLLEVLADGATIEHVAAALETDLDELGPWLKKLEEEGLVRVGTRGSARYG